MEEKISFESIVEYLQTLLRRYGWAESEIGNLLDSYPVSYAGDGGHTDRLIPILLEIRSILEEVLADDEKEALEESEAWLVNFNRQEKLFLPAAKKYLLHMSYFLVSNPELTGIFHDVSGSDEWSPELAPLIACEEQIKVVLKEGLQLESRRELVRLFSALLPVNAPADSPELSALRGESLTIASDILTTLEVELMVFD